MEGKRNFNYLSHFQDKQSLFNNENEEKINRNISKYDQDHLKQSISTKENYNRNKSKNKQNLYVCKLQSKILEMQKKIDHQHFQIQTLTGETQMYIKNCEQQKQQIQNNNTNIIRQQYEQQIEQLIEQKQKISQIVSNLWQQYTIKTKRDEEKLIVIRQGNNIMTQKLNKQLSHKEELLLIIADKDKQSKIQQNILMKQEERKQELRNISRKLFIALKEVQLYRNKK